MKLITTPRELKENFMELIDAYENISFTTAWASMPRNLIEKLLARKERIVKGVVGLHFYQTDPEFLKLFIDDGRVRTIWQSDGTFHPKMYLFFNSKKDWTLIVGSLNFTNAAFNLNTEAVFLITDRDASPSIFPGAVEFINKCWIMGEEITKDNLEWYRLRWNRMRKKRGELTECDFIGNNKTVTSIMKLDWKGYVNRFMDRKELVSRRFEMLESIRSIFSGRGSLYRMTEDERRLICGNPNALVLPGADMYAHFGRSGNGEFMTRVINGNRTISDALDVIPLIGNVTEVDFKKFISIFLSEGKTTKGWVSSATRLLAVKRPDIFYCMTDGNRAGFCKEFVISRPLSKNLNNYWKIILQRIQDSCWYNYPEPQNEFELKLQNSKVAMLDMLYYKHL